MSPSRMRCPRISTSAVAVRAMWVTGLHHRSISSTAPGISVGSLTSRSHSSGCSMSANVPSAIRFRVVSLPATSNRNAKFSRSSSVNLAPSTSAVLKTDSMSFRGSARRAAISCWKYSNSSPMATNESSSISGSALPVHASDHLRNFSQSSGGAPSNSAIIRVGRGAASASANSTVEPGSDVVEDPVDDLAHLRLEDRHLPPGEPGVDQLAQLTVPRRVGEDEVALLNRVRHHGVGDGDALGRGELVRVGGHVPDVLVLQQRPELGDVVPAHRLVRAQFLVGRVRVAGEEVGGVQRERRYAGQPPSTPSAIRHIGAICPISSVSTRCAVTLSMLDDPVGYQLS